MLEKRRVLLQFVSDLVNDENAVRRERIIRFPKERPFLLDLQNAKRYARKDVITGSDAVAFQLEWQRRCISMDYMNTWIICKLSLQITRERRVQLKQEQMRVRTHSSRDFARVHAFAWAVLGDHPMLAEIHLTGDAFHHRSRAGNDRDDLKWTLQVPLEKECAHVIEIVVRTPQVVQ